MGKKSKRRANRRSQPPPAAAVGSGGQPPPPLQQQPAPVVLSRRTVVDRLIEKFQEASDLHGNDSWHQDRVQPMYQIFSKKIFSTCSPDDPNDMVLSTRLYSSTRQDWKFLRRIRKSETQPVLFRVWANLLTGIVGISKNYEVIRYYDNAIALCDSASFTDQQRIVLLGDEYHQVGVYLKTQMRDDAYRFPRMINESVSDIDAAMPPLVAGLQCDVCCKKREEHGLTTLLHCARCQMAHYCSVECQRKAWLEQGHRQVCRRRGEFKEGDAAYILEPVDLHPRDEGEVMEIVGNFRVDELVRIIRVEDTRWVVESTIWKGGRGFVGDVRHLKRCRPALWNPDIKAEYDVLRRANRAIRANEAGLDPENGSHDEGIMPDLENGAAQLSDDDDDDDDE